jgi:hypothetical protein
MAKQRDLIRKRHVAKGEVVRVDVHIPQPGHQVGALQVDERRIRIVELFIGAEQLFDASLVDHHCGVLAWCRLDTVDERRVA